MHAVASLSCITIGFIVYHFLTQSLSLKKSFERKWGVELTKVYWIYFQRLLGVLIFGIIPLAVVFSMNLDLKSIGVSAELSFLALWWTIGLSLVVVIMNFFVAKAPDNLAMYPQIRISSWSMNLVFGSSITWVLYLLAYEFLFRGFLLFSWHKETGAILAIAVNVSVYALVHIPKGIKEAVGAIPLGILLCILTLKTGTIWIAVFVHIAMALSNEWFSIYYGNLRR